MSTEPGERIVQRAVPFTRMGCSTELGRGLLGSDRETR